MLSLFTYSNSRSASRDRRAFLGVLIFVTNLFLFSAANAGLLEVLSEATNPLWNETSCSKEYSHDKVFDALEKGDRICELRPRPSIANQASDLATIQKAIPTISDAKYRDKLFGRYFGMLATQHSVELDCAADFANLVAAKDPVAIPNLTEKIHLLRQAKMELNETTQKIANDMSISTKFCPLSLEDLKPSPMPDGMIDTSFDACKKVITSRTAYFAIFNTIPIANAPSVSEFLDMYANMRAGPELDKIEKDFAGSIGEAFRKGGLELRKESTRLKDMVATKGGEGFDRGERYALLQDPRVIGKVIQASGGGPDVQGLACQADARYGKGAEALEKTMLVGSLALSGGVALAARTSVVAAEVATAASAARTTGLLSVNAMRALQITSMAAGSIGAYSHLDRACSLGDPPKFLTTGTELKSQKCVSAPTVEQLDRDSCVLNASLTAIGYIVPIRSLAFGARNLVASRTSAETNLLFTRRTAAILKKPTQAQNAEIVASEAGQTTTLVRQQALARAPLQKVSMDNKYLGENAGNSEFGRTLRQPWFVKYFSPTERAKYLVTVQNGKLVDATGAPITSRNAIYVVDPDGKLYVVKTGTIRFFNSQRFVAPDGTESYVRIHHSSILAGDDIAIGGHLDITNGQITAINRASGHYKPSSTAFKRTVENLKAQGVDFSKANILDSAEELPLPLFENSNRPLPRILKNKPPVNPGDPLLPTPNP